MKNEKIPLFAAVINFFFWGTGYIYLEKKADEGFYLIVSYLMIWIFTFWYLTVAGPLVFAGVYWIIFWSLWVGIYIGYDSYRLAKVRK